MCMRTWDVHSVIVCEFCTHTLNVECLTTSSSNIFRLFDFSIWLIACVDWTCQRKQLVWVTVFFSRFRFSIEPIAAFLFDQLRFSFRCAIRMFEDVATNCWMIFVQFLWCVCFTVLISYWALKRCRSKTLQLSACLRVKSLRYQL